MFNKIFYWIFTYSLGSIPFAVLVNWLFKKYLFDHPFFVNKKRYYTISQLFITLLLDALKGFLAVYIGMQMGYSEVYQAIGAVFCILGHNWSIFMSFKGGRGLATYVGALFAFSPQLFMATTAIFVGLSLFLGSGISSLFSIVAVAIIARSIDSWNAIAYYTFFATLPLFIKRMSPYKDYLSPHNRVELLRARLFYGTNESNEINWIKRIRQLTKKDK